MKVRTGIMVAALLLGATVGALAAEKTADKTADEPGAITVRMTHRVFAAFADTQQVTMGEEFYVGDTEYSAVIEEFNPDFGIKQDGTVVTRSPVPHNPAFLIKVLQDGRQVDEVWAFLGGGAPHFRRNSLIGFQVLSFVWQGHTLTAPVPQEAP